MNIETARYLEISELGQIKIDNMEGLIDRSSRLTDWEPLDITLYLDTIEDNTIQCTQDNVNVLFALASFMQDHITAKPLTKTVKSTKIKKK